MWSYVRIPHGATCANIDALQKLVLFSTNIDEYCMLNWIRRVVVKPSHILHKIYRLIIYMIFLYYLFRDRTFINNWDKGNISFLSNEKHVASF